MNRVGDIVQEEGGVGRLGERLTHYNNIRINDHFLAYEVSTCRDRK